MLPPDTAREPADRSEREAVLFWRLAQLVEAGYSWEEAFEVAVDAEIDLHLAQTLLERGCPRSTALRILL